MVDERELALALRAALYEDIPPGSSWVEPPTFRDSALGALLARQDDAGARALGVVVSLVLERAGLADYNRGEVSFQQRIALRRLAATISRRPLQWTESDVWRLVPLVSRPAGDSWVWQFDWLTPTVARMIVSAAESCRPSPALVEWLGGFAGMLTRTEMYPAEERGRTVGRIRRVVSAASGATSFDVDALLSDIDPWARAARQMLTGLQPSEELGALLHHLARSGLRASNAWQSKCVRLIAAASQSEECLQALVYGLVGVEHQPMSGRPPLGWIADIVDATNVGVVRGALWATALGRWAWSAAALRDVGVHCATSKGGGATPRSEKLANASILALGALGDDDAISALVAIKTRAKKVTLLRQTDRVLQAAAQRLGITELELLERAVPTLGLGEHGVREQRVGDYTARVRLDDAGLKLEFVDESGRSLRATPARVRTDHAEEVAALRTLTRDGQKAFATERSRIESLFAEEPSWDYETWNRRYVRHPLSGFFGRRLIWTFEHDGVVTSAMPISPEAFADSSGRVVEAIPEATTVRLWHPAGHSVDAVEAWRSTLLDRALHQPFRQAFREIYLVTPAELETNTYSNRFTAHILRYPQAYVLMRTRRWIASGLGYWEGSSAGSAVREFSSAGLRAVFYYQLVEGDYGDYADVTPRLCATDQVRFESLDDPGTAIPIASVPPLVFSEAMRDVDLFVGVTSIASDPNWIDTGSATPFAGYWHSVSFGELVPSAQLRRQALERLIPQTKIAERCTLAERFLVVRGDIRTYKIHIGSGSILMEPNDQYLCVVPRRVALPDRLFLPFEEDGGLLATILSKAFLLADDRAITDESIRRQIAR